MKRLSKETDRRSISGQPDADDTGTLQLLESCHPDHADATQVGGPHPSLLTKPYEVWLSTLETITGLRKSQNGDEVHD